jgi:hypothetical protein
MRKLVVSVYIWASICSSAICQVQQKAEADRVEAQKAEQKAEANRIAAQKAIPPELIKIFETEKSVFGQFHLAPIIIPKAKGLETL